MAWKPVRKNNPRAQFGIVRKDFPSRLEEIRKARGLTVSEYSELIGMTRNAYYQVLNRFSGRDHPGGPESATLSLDTIVRFMATLNLGFWDILEKPDGVSPKIDPDEVSVGYFRDLITDPDYEEAPRLRSVVERAWRAQRAFRRRRKLDRQAQKQTEALEAARATVEVPDPGGSPGPVSPPGPAPVEPIPLEE